MFLIAALAHIHWASGLKFLNSAVLRHCQPVFYVNRVQQFKRQTSSQLSAHSEIAPGFAEFLYLYKGAVHSAATLSTRGFQRKLGCPD